MEPRIENKIESMEIKKLVFTMSFPIMISMLVQALYNIVDSMFVARISQNALAAVSLCFPIQMIIVAVACGTAVGMNALLSRYLGEKRYEDANQVALHGIVLAICNWLLFASIGFLFSETFLRLFSTDEDIIKMGVGFMRICTIFSFGVFVQITYERIMQSTGNTFYNMIIQGVGALINIILDPIFIYGLFGFPKLGVRGAAIATVIGQIIAMLIGVIITKKRIKQVYINLFDFKFSVKLIKKIYKIGLPAIIMQSIMSFMTVFMNMLLISFSDVAVSVFSIYYKLQQFVFMAVLGMNNALIPIIAYNYGAKSKERIIEAIRFALLLSCIIMSVGTLIFQLIPEQLLYLFNAEDEMLSIGVSALRYISVSFVFAGISLVLCSVFQSLEHGVESLIITSIRQMLLLIPLAYILAYSFGLNACWWAFPITEACGMVIALRYLRRIKQAKLDRL